MSYSKILTCIATIIFVLTIVSGIILSVKGYDCSIYSYAISTSGGVWGLTMVSYFRKASLENNIKIQLGMLHQILKLKQKYKNNETINEMANKVEQRLNDTVDNAINESLTPPDIPNL